MNDEKNIFNQTIKSYIKTSENFLKMTTGQGHHYAAGCLLDYYYFKKNLQNDSSRFN